MKFVFLCRGFRWTRARRCRSGRARSSGRRTRAATASPSALTDSKPKVPRQAPCGDVHGCFGELIAFRNQNRVHALAGVPSAVGRPRVDLLRAQRGPTRRQCLPVRVRACAVAGACPLFSHRPLSRSMPAMGSIRSSSARRTWTPRPSSRYVPNLCRGLSLPELTRVSCVVCGVSGEGRLLGRHQPRDGP